MRLQAGDKSIHSQRGWRRGARLGADSGINLLPWKPDFI